LAGGSLLQCIFLTAILMYMIDRKFIRGAVWSLLAGILSFFGLIHSTSIGVLYRANEDGWRFTVGYAILTVVFVIFEIAQRLKWVEGPETEPDDLSSEEWAEWNRRKQSNENINQF
jgi:adenine/guanine/hypoxanthine permease